MNGNGHTPTQQRILNVLDDGAWHSRFQVLDAIGDSEASLATMRIHLTRIRKVLRPRGQDVVCEMRGSMTYYRWVRHVNSPDDQDDS